MSTLALPAGAKFAGAVLGRLRAHHDQQQPRLFAGAREDVMAADRNQGWALDSFDRYKEFRYCISVNVIGFVYSGAQALDMSYNLATGKYMVHQQPKLRHYLNFAADQASLYCRLYVI
ncbi:hypothetical protein SASPL_139694 [Salvia splendens]|uniref:CASP-like protein n=1 Tax=Salvia splendens TaxID=180675 RepID=A0A8X8WPG8_SALSN|nr:hypothetical protein SASPL_139694 [Salvia splendens]